MAHWRAALTAGLLCGCTTPPPVPPVVTLPPVPAAPISRDQYLQGFVQMQAESVFSGGSALQSGVHWLVSGTIANRGNRDIVWLEAEFHVTPKGGVYRHIVLDPLEGQDGVDAGAVRGFTIPICPLDQGIVGEYDPEVSVWPAPRVEMRVVGLKFADEID